jgi:hypothetical protein
MRGNLLRWLFSENRPISQRILLVILLVGEILVAIYMVSMLFD